MAVTGDQFHAKANMNPDTNLTNTFTYVHDPDCDFLRTSILDWFTTKSPYLYFIIIYAVAVSLYQGICSHCVWNNQKRCENSTYIAFK